MALICDSTSYSLVINSADRVSGTNNNATYQINWRDFLPDNFDTYKMAFSFQTIGGYYSDGLFSTNGNNVGYTASSPINGAVVTGATSLVVSSGTNFAVGQVIVCSVGIPSGTLITNVSTNTITFNTALTAPIPNTGLIIYGFTTANMNTATFSSARVILQNQGRSFSFDTQSKGPSSNIGILQRDIQLATSKSNSLSCFYCQNPPRTLARPNQNMMTINIMNSYSFSGGIIGYSSSGVPIYSTASTNQNFLTDTNATGSIQSTDMTGYTMLLEFIPIILSTDRSRAGI